MTLEEMTNCLTLNAYAKLNLGLRVLGLRNDGFHELHTHMHTIDLFDELTFQKTSNAIGIDTEPATDIPLEKNLIYKAIRLFQQKSDLDQNVHVQLEKVIPVGAGLGGGSSDAAATLVAMNQLFNTNYSNETLAEWGAELGSDIPFFIEGGFACAKGRGEVLKSLDSPYLNHTFVVISPPIKCSTPEVFQTWDELFESDPIKDLECEQMDHHNDLQASACHQYPEMMPYRELIQDAPTKIKGMSGSGSSWYVGFSDEGEAKVYQRQLESLDLEAQTYCVKTMTRRNHDA